MLLIEVESPNGTRLRFKSDKSAIDKLFGRSILQGVVAGQEIEGEKIPDPLPTFEEMNLRTPSIAKTF